MINDKTNNTPHVQIETLRPRRKRGLATVAVLLLIALPVSGFMMVAVDRVQDASDRAT